MRRSGLCLRALWKEDGARYTKNDSQTACQNLSCDDLTARLPVAKDLDQLKDI
jgi:hypothetical protein